MRRVAFKQVDVFTDTPFQGNPLAVILDGEGLTDRQMQQIARWTNLSETTFVLAPTHPDADYRLRIFTTVSELPFAGHPSVGSAHALREAGRLPSSRASWVMECAAGLRPMRIEQDDEYSDAAVIFVRVPAAELQPADPRVDAELAVALGLSAGAIQHARAVNVGPIWLIADIGDAQRLLDLQPDAAALLQLSQKLAVTGVTVFAGDETEHASCVLRSFCPGEGMFEDPVCGSGNAAVAAYRRARGDFAANAASYRARQGQCLGRNGFVDVRVSVDSSIEIGGQSVTTIDGYIRLD